MLSLILATVHVQLSRAMKRMGARKLQGLRAGIGDAVEQICYWVNVRGDTT
jgi:hypothetical protein